MNEKLFVLNSQKKSTSHVLHLILTVLTCGVWLIVWGCIATSNSNHNARIDKDMKRVLYYKEQGVNDADIPKKLREDKASAAKSDRKAILLVIVIMTLFIYLWLH